MNAPLGACISERAPHPAPDPFNSPPTPRTWAQTGEFYQGVGITHDTLPPGMYLLRMLEHGIALERTTVATDNLLQFPDSAAEAVLKEMQHFQASAPRYRQHGFLHKRGILLEGPPGSGKTSVVQQLVQLVVEREQGIALYLTSPFAASTALRVIRAIEPLRPVLGILEDFDGLLQAHGEHEFLPLLDGEAQADNVVMVATTNYLHEIPERFRDRPSRFDLVKHIGMPSPAAREMYLRHKLPEISSDTLLEMVAATANYSIAHLREFIALTQIFDYTIPDAAARLHALAVAPKPARTRGQLSGAGFVKGAGL